MHISINRLTYFTLCISMTAPTLYIRPAMRPYTPMSSSVSSSSSSTSSMSTETALELVNSDLNKKLAEAIHHNNQTLVQYYITKGANLSQYRGGFLPLHQAVKNGLIDIVCTLIDRRADINGRTQESLTDKGRTALHLAAAHGHEKIAHILLQSGALRNPQIEGVDGFEGSSYIGYTPLHSAAEKGHSNVVKVLIEHTVDIEAQDSIGRTPLHVAAEKGRSAVVEMLCKNNANKNSQDNYMRTPLHLAADEGNDTVVNILIRSRVNLNVQDSEGHTPLHRATEKGHQAVIKILCEKGALVNSINKTGLMPLHLAAQNNHLAATQILMQAGASTKSKDLQRAHTPFFHTLRTPSNRPEDDTNRIIIQMLLLMGKVPFKKLGKAFPAVQKVIVSIHDFNFYPLYTALNKNHDHLSTHHKELEALLSAIPAEVVTIIIEYHDCTDTRLLVGKKVVDLINSAAYKSLTTGLYKAIRSKNSTLVKEYIKNGADLRIADKNGFFPLHQAVFQGNIDIIKELITGGADVNAVTCWGFKQGTTALHLAAERGCEEIVKHLLNNKALTDKVTEDGTTLLHAAAAGGMVSLIERLMQDRVNPNVYDREKNTPLHIAVWRNHKAVVDKLVEVGAHVNIQNCRGKHPLHCAADHCTTNVMDKLIDAGADVNIQDNNGETPFDLIFASHFPAFYDECTKAPLQIKITKLHLFAGKEASINLEKLRQKVEDHHFRYPQRAHDFLASLNEAKKFLPLYEKLLEHLLEKACSIAKDIAKIIITYHTQSPEEPLLVSVDALTFGLKRAISDKY